MFIYTFSISSDITSGILNNSKLMTDIVSSSITASPLSVSTRGDEIEISFSSELSSSEQATLLTLLNAHDGTPESEVLPPAEVKIVEEVASAPFASKTLSNGQKLFKRVHGVYKTVSANSSGTVRFTVPYLQAKINGLEIVGANHGDTANFNVYDNAAGTVSTIPNYKLNQFGFNVCLKPVFHKEESQYDADVIQGMVLELEFTNSQNSETLIGANFILHELTQ